MKKNLKILEDAIYYPNKKKMYRKVFNRNSNDFNDEPEYKDSPYWIYGEYKDKYIVTRAGWDGIKDRHMIKKEDFHPNRKEYKV